MPRLQQKQWDVFRLDTSTDNDGHVTAQGWYYQAYDPNKRQYEGDLFGPFETKEAALTSLHRGATVPSGPYSVMLWPQWQSPRQKISH